ncbi:hypothetical protein ACE6H2_004344 [Prunus campanulata]
MAATFLCLALLFLSQFSLLASSASNNLSLGSSLSVENEADTLISPNGLFSAGFFPVGENAYCFGIWYTEPAAPAQNLTVVWIANRDEPVNGRSSKLTLQGNARRTPYNNTRVAVLDAMGNFSASDGLIVIAADYGTNLQRRLKADVDGNLRLYSRKQAADTWVVSWQAIQQPCKIHGICGPNGLCTYDPSSGRKCSCLPGYEMRNKFDWAYGCQPATDGFNLSCKSSDRDQFDFMYLPRVEYYGYDYSISVNTTLEKCKALCLELCSCPGFHYKFGGGHHNCYPKTQFRNGYRAPGFQGELYLKLPKSILSSYNSTTKESNMCSSKLKSQLDRTYEKSKQNGSVKFMLKFASGLGALEVVCVFLVWFFLTRRNGGDQVDSDDVVTQGYLHAATGFRRFSYSELKKATRGFKEEIGRGGGGIVYKGVLCDERIAAIKQLNGANQGEAEFLAERPAESVQAIEGGGETEKKMMVTWVKEKMHGTFTKAESQMGADYEQGRLEMLVKVALQCLEEDRDARPTMSQVVEMLLHHENNL